MLRKSGPARRIVASGDENEVSFEELLHVIVTFIMIVKNSKQSLETKRPRTYSHSLELVTIVIVINVVIGGLSGERTQDDSLM